MKDGENAVPRAISPTVGRGRGRINFARASRTVRVVAPYVLAFLALFDLLVPILMLLAFLFGVFMERVYPR